MASKAIFLDKDGTLIDDIPFNVDPELIRFSEGAEAALSSLKDLDYKLIVITNQSGVAHGFFPEQALNLVQKRLEELFVEAGVTLTGFYYCPHHLGGKVEKYTVPCYCHKPQPGMILQAAMEHDLDLASSWVMGDILNDVEAGNRAGCRTILLNNGHETEWNLSPIRRPDFIVSDLKEAAQVIADEFLVEQVFAYEQYQ
ncbi:MAG: HAD family hydrolase [Anaerolineales bacterium]